jgi:3-deoxy-7-phosphoheptulonate synthase
MALISRHKLPDAAALAAEFPVTDAHRVDEHRAAIADIIARRDPRLMMIVGPCSAWPSEAVLEYADRLARLQEEVKERILLVMRCYVQKPRTTVGWPGPLNAPDPAGPVDISAGVRESTKLMYEAGLRAPLADEMLFTHNADYFAPRLSYVALGARSAEDMEHRYIASGLEMPVGVKNTTGGDIGIGVNGVLSVQAPHVFAHHQHEVETTGNPYAHLILRGGGGRSNYDPQSIAFAKAQMEKLKIKNPSIVVDASHDNSKNGHGKDPELQEMVVHSIVEGIRRQREEYRTVSGVMIESFLKQGSQPEKGPAYDMDGLSITDPCLGWERTEALIRETADAMPS